MEGVHGSHRPSCIVHSIETIVNTHKYTLELASSSNRSNKTSEPSFGDSQWGEPLYYFGADQTTRVRNE